MAAGCYCRKAAFSNGTEEIIKVEGKVPNTKGTINFESVGKKYLLLRFSRLGSINK